MAAEVIESLVVKELHLGEYTSGAATDSTGFILIKDAAGNDRKVMIQA